MYLQTVLFVIILGYMIGSFPTAYLVGRINGINIFELGSGNMGTTNALRALGRKWGITVMIVDVGKGILAVWLGRKLALANPGTMSQASASVVSAIAVVCGHNWSFAASVLTGKIRGGKGAATAAGTWIILMPAIVIAIPIAIFSVIVITTRYMSLGVLIGAITAALVIGGMVLLHQIEPVYLLYLVIIGMLFLRHRDNIKRLVQGKERRVGERVQTSQ